MPPAPPVLPPALPSPWRACHAPDPWECMPQRELHPRRHVGPPWSLDSWARPTDGDDSGPTNGSRQPWTIGSRAAGPPHGPPLYKPSPTNGELICVVHFSAEPCQIFARAPTGGNGFRRYDVSILVLEISLLFGRRPCHPASRMGSAPHPARLCSRRIAVRMGCAPYVRRQASWMCCRTRDGWRSLSCRPL
jgi:hypothetical protein